MTIMHPRHWRLIRIQGRFNWVVSVTARRGFRNWQQIGWR